ncbi:AAA family ATPase [Bartonella sp. HY406]|uniref:AAA family ATPase n=1 Tax=Bartonella sp. HY406 TaxID=2979331 RepID=UPI0021C7E2E6|nr:AAA family ATPase [Bartonella sp. HY406]UXN02789.1 AAA family ATPase [Bartonella sp. HY406]
MIDTLAIFGYRSIRDLIVPLDNLTIITGANGVGKSNLYRSLRLLASAANGELVGNLAKEGGIQSVFWAGPEKITRDMRSGRAAIQGTVSSQKKRLKLGFSSRNMSYAVELGFPTSGALNSSLESMGPFRYDPLFKRETLWSGALRQSSIHALRKGALLSLRDLEGELTPSRLELSDYESMCLIAGDPQASPQLLELRETLLTWRFYDHLRTDSDAPSRKPQIGTYTPIMANDGSDVAAALQTILQIGDYNLLAEMIDLAFPEAEIDITHHEGWFGLQMRQNGILRPLKAAELSDGTMRYIMLLAALLTPRPPSLMVLNEPETSLHPDLLPALAKLICAASKNMQLIVVSHAQPLVDLLEKQGHGTILNLYKEFSETTFKDNNLINRVGWKWPD